MSATAWHVTDEASFTVFLVWVWASLINSVVRIRRPEADRSALRWLHNELRPFALPALVLSQVADILAGHHQGVIGNIVFAINVVNWWLIRRDRHDDDDRWQRRRDRLAGKVAEVDGRLVVVPE